MDIMCTQITSLYNTNIWIVNSKEWDTQSLLLFNKVDSPASYFSTLFTLYTIKYLLINTQYESSVITHVLSIVNQIYLPWTHTFNLKDHNTYFSAKLSPGCSHASGSAFTFRFKEWIQSQLFLSIFSILKCIIDNAPGSGQGLGTRHGWIGCMVLCRTSHTAPERGRGLIPIVPIVLVLVPFPVLVPDTASVITP